MTEAACMVDWRAFGLAPPNLDEGECAKVAEWHLTQGCEHEHIQVCLACGNCLAIMRSYMPLDQWWCARCIERESSHECPAPLVAMPLPCPAGCWKTGDDESRTVVPSAFFGQLLAEDAGPPEATAVAAGRNDHRTATGGDMTESAITITGNTTTVRLAGTHDLITEEACLAQGGHCFKRTGVTLTSNPPQYPEKCKHCGKGRVAIPREPFEYREG